MNDGGMTKIDKALLSIDFFTEMRILSKKEAKSIKQYLSGTGLLIDVSNDFEVDESECSQKIIALESKF